MTAPTLVAEDWTVDPLEPEGAVELYRRLLDARRVGGMVGWRFIVVATVLVAAFAIACAVAVGLDVIGIERGDDDPPRDLATNLGLAGFFLASAYGSLALMRLGIRRLRALAAATG
jgi:hypothetical protein